MGGMNTKNTYTHLISKPEQSTNITYNYIFILQLSTALALGPKSPLSKLELPKGFPHSLYEKQIALVAGFGYDSMQAKIDSETNEVVGFQGDSTDKLRFGRTMIMSNDKCESFYKNTIYPSHLCSRMEQRANRKPEGNCMVCLFFTC